MRDKPVSRWKAARVSAGRIAAGCLCALLLGACSRSAPPSAAAAGSGSGSGSALKPGTYRVVLQIPGGDLPFGLDLSREDSAWLGYLVNGAERVKLSEVVVDGGHLE